MDLEQWRAELATRPATVAQLGALHEHFQRLGCLRSDRGRRLAACAALLGLDDLDTMRQLSQGQAGQLVKTLSRITSPAELAALAGQVPPVTENHAIPGRPQDTSDDYAPKVRMSGHGRRFMRALISQYVAAELPNLTGGGNRHSLRSRDLARAGILAKSADGVTCVRQLAPALARPKFGRQVAALPPRPSSRRKTRGPLRLGDLWVSETKARNVAAHIDRLGICHSFLPHPSQNDSCHTGERSVKSGCHRHLSHAQGPLSHGGRDNHALR